jgi:hypothetical protein
VTVGRGLGDNGSRYGSARAGHILDDERPSEIRAEPIREQSGENVGITARA